MENNVLEFKRRPSTQEHGDRGETSFLLDHIDSFLESLYPRAFLIWAWAVRCDSRLFEVSNKLTKAAWGESMEDFYSAAEEYRELHRTLYREWPSSGCPFSRQHLDYDWEESD